MSQSLAALGIWREEEELAKEMQVKRKTQESIVFWKHSKDGIPRRRR